MIPQDKIKIKDMIEEEETEELETCPICGEIEPHDHDFDKQAAQLEEIFSRMGTENPI